MVRDELQELHYITPTTNLPSIMKAGLLSHDRAHSLSRQSVADPAVQERRRHKRIPNGRRLHEYVNLYVNARNKMLYRVRSTVALATVCVLRVSTAVLDIDGP